MRFAGIFLSFCIVFGACRKDADTATPPASKTDQASDMIFSFSAVVAGQGKVVKDCVFYDNHLGDKFTVSLFKYYISNVVLIGSDNTTFTEPESYHLIDHFGGKESFTITN